MAFKTKSSLLTSLSFLAFKLIVFGYDIITLPIYFIIQMPWIRRDKKNTLRAVQIDPEDPYASWIRVGKPPKHYIQDCKTIDEAIRLTIERSPKWKQCLGYRQVIDEELHYINGNPITKLVLSDQYIWLTYDQFNDRVNHIGKGLLFNGVKPQQSVMIFADTCLEWFICAQSLFRIGASLVTLYSTLSDEGIIHGITETQVTHIITSQSLLPRLQKIQYRLENVTTIIFIDGVKPAPIKGFDLERLKLLSLTKLEETGKNLPPELIGIPPTEDDIAIVLYTSGSTGTPKGVIITHKNFMKAAAAYLTVVGNMMKDVEKHRYIGYLPLAHILEFATETFLFIVGVKIGYSSPYTLTDLGTAIKIGHKGDATLLRPTLMAAVPLVLDRIRKGIYEKIDKRAVIVRKVFDFIVNYKTFWTQKGFDTPLINFLICRKFRELIGGKIVIMMVGGAPLSPDTQKLIKACLNTILFQGYASTETTGVGAIMDEKDQSLGRVGAPLFGVKMRLTDWEEGGYRVTDKPNPRGEIIIGSEAVSSGYLHLVDATKESYYYDSNGEQWFLTGDIGEVFPDGTFKIIDRKKDLIKLQFGEYVSLGKIEAELKNCKIVDNICVVGNSYYNYLIAIIIPNMVVIEKMAKELDIIYDSTQEQLENDQIIATVLNQIREFGVSAKLNRFEIPVKIKLCADEWTPDNGLVTAAMKLKRKQICDKYKKDIDIMYDRYNNNNNNNI